MTRLDDLLKNKSSGGTTLDKYISSSGADVQGAKDFLSQRDTQNQQNQQIALSQQRATESLQEFDKSQEGWKGALNKFLGFGQAKPTLAVETPEYTQQRIESIPKTFGENLKGVGKFLVEGEQQLGEGLGETFNVGSIAEIKQKEVMRNVALQKKWVDELAQTQDEERKKFLKENISAVYKKNQEVAESIKQDLTPEEKRKLAAGVIETGIDIGTAGLGSLIKSPVKALLKTGKKKVVKNAVKKQVVKKGILQTVKKVAEKPITEGAIFGGVYGATGKAYEDGEHTLKDYAKSAAVGSALGAGLVGGIGLIASKLGKKAPKLEKAIKENKVTEKEIEDIFKDKGITGVNKKVDELEKVVKVSEAEKLAKKKVGVNEENNLKIFKEAPKKAKDTERFYHTSAMEAKFEPGDYLDTNLGKQIDRGTPSESKFVLDIPKNKLDNYLDPVARAKGEFKITKKIPKEYIVFEKELGEYKPKIENKVELKKTTDDASTIQELKNSVLEGKNILRSGTFNGRKLSKDELDSVVRSVENAQAKIGVQSKEGYKVQELSSDTIFGKSGGFREDEMTKEGLRNWKLLVKRGEAEVIDGKYYKAKAPVKKVEPIVNKAEPVKVTPKTVEPTKTSKIARSIEAKAIEQKLTTGFSEIAEYSPKVIKEQAELTSKLLSEDIEKAKRIITGAEDVPANMKSTALITAAEEYISKVGDADLAYKLANSPLTSETSVAGQTLRFARERTQDSATTKLKEIRDIKRNAFEKKKGKIGQAVNKEKAKIKDTIKKQIKPTKETWGSFISEITCN